jgi:eukaryotic-like serine/threonine-protein kinase
MPALASNLVGQLLAGRYRVESIIGQGGQGVVYRARDEKANRAVALKVLNEAVARDPQAAGRFMREQAALEALAGTAAVQAYDAGEMADGGLYLVLELLEGRDLEQELKELEGREERMDLKRIAELITPIAETLDSVRAFSIAI